MHPHLIVVFSEEENMIAEYECNHLVKLEHSIEASYKESTERIKFFKVLDHNLLGRPHLSQLNRMMRLKQRNKIIKPQFLIVLMRLCEVLIYFFYNGVVYHCESVLHSEWQ